MSQQGRFDSADLARWHRDLLRYAHRLTGDPDVSEDLAQEAMLRLLRTEQTGPLENPRAWLYRVVTNLVRDRARWLERRQRKHAYLATHDEAEPVGEVERREVQAEVRAVLDRLSPRDREMLILRESGFQHREIAEIIGVQPQSVSVLLARAFERFKNAYLQTAAT